jgi:hypothetical protein
MNSKRQIFAVSISASIFLAVAVLVGSIINHQAFAQQNATNTTLGATNQTANDPTANLTAASLQPLQDNLNEAREALQNNNTAEALDALNEADSQLFELSTSQASSSDDNDDETSEDNGE